MTNNNRNITGKHMIDVVKNVHIRPCIHAHLCVGCRSRNLSCPLTDIFRKYPTSVWYICR